MRIKIKVCISGKKTYNVGEITEDFTDIDAEKLIKAGYAQKVENESKANSTTKPKATKPKRG